MKKQMQLVRCTVNGREVEEYVDVRESLLDMLRNRLGLTSVKKGCEVGECGACTVIIDGETIDSCIYFWLLYRRSRTHPKVSVCSPQDLCPAPNHATFLHLFSDIRRIYFLFA